MLSAMDCYGNPSSTHTAGQAARAIVEEARRDIARALGVSAPKPGEIIFTGCGSEADNLAILGAAHAKTRRTANRILTTAGEHSAVRRPLDALAAEGFEVIEIPTTGGRLDLDFARGYLDEKLFMITAMLVNNETGADYSLDLASLFRAARQAAPQAMLHCDAIQGFLKVPLAAKTLGADMIALSAHKIGGPKGVGALWVDPRILTAKRLVPTLLGGGQEQGYRSGTENVIGIAGFGAAAKAGHATLARDIEQMTAQANGFIAALNTVAPEVRVNLPARRASHILSLTLPRIKSETMLNYLSRAGVCISAGSACSSHAKHKTSAALAAFGLPAPEADATVRISLAPTTTADELTRAAHLIADGVASLVRF